MRARKEVIMANMGRAKKFVRYNEGAELYSMGVSKFKQLAHEAKAVYKVDKIPVKGDGQMGLKIRDTDLLDKYKKVNAHKRLDLMMEYYPVFPGMLRKIEKKTEYKIKAEKEYIKSHCRDELGVRVQTSGKSDPTANEAVANVALEEAFKNGDVDKGMLKDVENADEYKETIRMVSIMRMDYELLVDIISGFDTDDSVIIRKHLSEGKSFRIIAEEE